jgi:hypothetical protein
MKNTSFYSDYRSCATVKVLNDVERMRMFMWLRWQMDNWPRISRRSASRQVDPNHDQRGLVRLGIPHREQTKAESRSNEYIGFYIPPFPKSGIFLPFRSRADKNENMSIRLAALKNPILDKVSAIWPSKTLSLDKETPIFGASKTLWPDKHIGEFPGA